MRKINRKSPLDFILPFLILLSIGVIGFLGYQLWLNIDKTGKADAYFYIVEGKAKLLPYGTAEWDNAYSGTKMLLGDSVKTLVNGRLVVKFFNGTLARLGDDSSVTLNDLNKQFDSEKITLNLNKGYLWMKAGKSSDVKEADYEIRSEHMKVKSKEAVFEVEDNDNEVVRVFGGVVNVDVIISSEGKERVADTITVGVGQELVLDDATLKAFEENKSPSVLKAVSDEFKTTDWYTWNSSEDKKPTDFEGTLESESNSDLITQQGENVANQTSSTQGAVSGAGETMQSSSASGSQQASAQTDGGDLVDVSGSDLEAPLIKAPSADNRTTKTGQKISITGTVGKAIAKVQVVETIDGTTDNYTLSKYVKGTGSFSYNVSEALGNLKQGDNIYKFYAIDESGNKSDPGEITITYEKGAVSVTGSLTAPEVVSFNGGSSSEVTADSVLIVGKVSGAEKVVVNGYQLSKFVPGDSSWSYSAKESLGNLKPGVNDFEVYSVGTDGSKSSITKFTVTYNKPQGSQATTGATSQTQPTQSSVTLPGGF